MNRIFKGISVLSIVLLSGFFSIASAQVGNITSIAGDGTGAGFGGAFGGDGGPATGAQLNFPTDAAVDAAGNVYITDRSNNVIRKVDAITGNISTIVGTGTASSTGDGGPAAAATLNNPHSVAVDAAGNIYITELTGGVVRKVDAVTGNISTIGSTFARGIFIDTNGDVYLAGFNKIEKIDGVSGVLSTVAGGTSGTGGDGGPATAAQIDFAIDVVLDAAGNLYFTELFGHRIRKVDAVTGIINTIAGTASTAGSTGDGGPAVNALLSSPSGLTIDGAGNLFVSQTGENVVHIRRIDAATGIITTVAGTGASSGSSGIDGDGGPALSATFNDPAGMAVNAVGDLLIADQVNHKVRQILGIAVPPGGGGGGGADPDTIKVTVGMGLVAPGDTIRIPVLIDNVDGPNVGGLQMAIVQQTATEAEFVGLEDTGNHPGMTVDSFEVIPGTVNFVLYSSNNSFIPPADPGPIQIATLVYVVDPSAPLGSTNELDIQGLLVGDEFGDEIAIKICPGAINVGIKGDINLDGDVDILDVILMSRILVESDPVPAEGTTGFKIADYNSDGTLDITDLMGMVNQILTTPPAPPGKHLAYGPVRVGLGHVVVMADGRIAVPLVLDGGMSLGGLEAVFRYDPSVLHVDTPVLSDGLSGIHLTSHVSDGVVRVVAFRMDADAVLPGDGRSVVLLPVSVVQSSGSASVTLSEGVGATVHAALASLTYGATVVDVPSVKSSAPASFSLNGNSPNPFNPSTTISYEVPVQSHIQLVVYNMLGQEVARLVDRVQAAGRYEIRWNARNTSGQAVSSGIYMYRLTSGDGYSATRRMTLLK